MITFKEFEEGINNYLKDVYPDIEVREVAKGYDAWSSEKGGANVYYSEYYKKIGIDLYPGATPTNSLEGTLKNWCSKFETHYSTYCDQYLDKDWKSPEEYWAVQLELYNSLKSKL